MVYQQHTINYTELQTNSHPQQSPLPHTQTRSQHSTNNLYTMASLIIGAGIFGYMQVKDRKAKKQEKARKAEEAREAELQSQLNSSVEYSYGAPNETGKQSQEYAELPAYSERLPRRSSSIYSQSSDTETRDNRDVKA